jgi:hypothetical protein
MKFYLSAITVLLTTIIASAQIHIGPGQTYANIQAGAAAAKPGDTIYVHSAEYTSYQFYQALQGIPDKWITITPWQNDTPVVRNMWQFRNMAYVRFVRMRFLGDASYTAGPFMNIDNGGDCAFQSHHVVIDHCEFGNNSTGNTLKFGGLDDFEVSNCSFRNQGDGNAGLAMNVCHNGWVHDNVFENVKGRAMQTKLGTRNVVFERNLVKNCGTIDAALRVGEAGDVIYHCAGDNWTAREIKVYSNIIIGGRASFAIGQAQNCEFVNNTFVNPASFAMRLLGEQPEFDCDSNLVKNNIFYLSSTRYFNASQGGSTNIDFASQVFGHNLFYYVPDSTWKPDPSGGVFDMEEMKGIQLTNILSGNPRFADVANDDFHIAAGSVALYKGATVSAPVSDFYGKPFHNPRSVGAVEYSGGQSGLKKEESKPDFILYPNPVSDWLYFAMTGTMGAPFTVEVYSAEGRLAKMEIIQSQQRISLTGLPEGIYMVKIQNGEKMLSRKIMILR